MFLCLKKIVPLCPIMSVTQFIHQDIDSRRFSFEVLPPLKGTGTEKLFADIDKLREFAPAYINITTHHSEFVYKDINFHLPFPQTKPPVLALQR